MEATLDHTVQAFRDNAFAASTKRTYRHYLSTYLHFCAALALSPVPLSVPNLGRYIAYLSTSRCFSSIRNYLTIVRLLHLEAGYDNPVDSHYIRSVLRGAKRVLGNHSHPKLPITIDILFSIFNQLVFSDPFDITFWAACLVAFFSFLRQSNLFAPSLSLCDPTHHLCRHHVTFTTSGASLQVTWSKTIQFKERGLFVPLPRLTNSPFCPCQALLLVFRLFPTPSHSFPVFMYRRGSRLVPLTSSSFISRLKCLLTTAGLDSSKYAGHSFRRGGATFAMECGAPSELIQAQGDWRSDCFRRYLDPSDGYRAQLAQAFAAQLRVVNAYSK